MAAAAAGYIERPGNRERPPPEIHHGGGQGLSQNRTSNPDPHPSTPKFVLQKIFNFLFHQIARFSEFNDGSLPTAQILNLPPQSAWLVLSNKEQLH